MQIVMFLTLGLFVNSDELFRPEVLILGCAVGAFMILVARPVTVFACLLPFRRFTTKARLYISWYLCNEGLQIIPVPHRLLSARYS